MRISTASLARASARHPWRTVSAWGLAFVAAAALVAVFAGFASGELVEFQQMGFGVAVSLLIDATIIRSILLPGAMALLGERNWYLPRWLEWLPQIGTEDQPAELATAEPEPAMV